MPLAREGLRLALSSMATDLPFLQPQLSAGQPEPASNTFFTLKHSQPGLVQEGAVWGAWRTEPRLLLIADPRS